MNNKTTKDKQQTTTNTTKKKQQQQQQQAPFQKTGWLSWVLVHCFYMYTIHMCIYIYIYRSTSQPTYQFPAFFGSIISPVFWRCFSPFFAATKKSSRRFRLLPPNKKPLRFCDSFFTATHRLNTRILTVWWHFFHRTHRAFVRKLRTWLKEDSWEGDEKKSNQKNNIKCSWKKSIQKSIQTCTFHVLCLCRPWKLVFV